MSNYIADVAKMLGVELYEEFEACGCGTFMFSDDWLRHKDSDGNWQDSPSTLVLLINGIVEIKKRPWRPKDGEDYYYIATTANHEPYITTYASRGMDVIRLRMGNFFKTYEEAKANVDKWLEYINQEPDLSWRNK